VTEPQATFSACFGAPFMVLHPSRYAKLLADKIRRHKVKCWLVNTGWSGGPYGGGRRIEIKYTRALLNGVLDGTLNRATYEIDPVFGVQIPMACPAIPSAILRPRDTWDDKDEYDRTARHVATLFRENFRQFEDQAPPEVRAATPQVAVTA
jgi:phosphoenolpyruvate carboxykinase (ATP)